MAELSLNGFTANDVSVLIFEPERPVNPWRGGFVAWLSRGGFLGDTMDRPDGVGVMDGTGVGAVFGGIAGTIWGSRWAYGPIIGMTLGMLVGGLVGYILDRLILERRRGELELTQIGGLILLRVVVRRPDRLESVRSLLRNCNVKQMADLPQIQAGAL